MTQLLVTASALTCDYITFDLKGNKKNRSNKAGAGILVSTSKHELNHSGNV